ncbi:MAG: fatty acid desaturase [Candidatus Marinimicrobia bacterium]|nr:fatty acid desaturase [Candidatus Neomarinimicrobiota bacterium]
MSVTSPRSETSFHSLADLKLQMEAVPWHDWLAKYRAPTLPKSLWQLFNSLALYVIGWVLLYHSLAVSYWLTLALMPIVAGMSVRIFIINHDCGHGSFFKQKWANTVVGFVTATLNFTPYFRWRYEHAIHHANSGDLNKRGTGGDVWTMKVEEYLAASRAKRLGYRLYRHPLVMFLVGPLWIFLVWHRFRIKKQRSREQWSVIWTNLALLAAITGLSLWIGLKAVLIIQLPMFAMAGSAGVWMFYVQHQYEGAVWAPSEDWDYATMSHFGSSYYKLPGVLRWFTGNIGFHHIHHLSPKIPNYLLQKAYRENPFFQKVTTLTFWKSFKSARLNLWWDMEQRLVGFREIKHLVKAQTG